MWPSKTSWSHISTLKNKAAKANALACKSKRAHNIFFRRLSVFVTLYLNRFSVLALIMNACVRFLFGSIIICLLVERIFYNISPLLGSISMMIRREKKNTTYKRCQVDPTWTCVHTHNVSAKESKRGKLLPSLLFADFMIVYLF